MPTNRMLNLRPSYEVVTRYCAAYQNQVLSVARSAGLPTTDLHGNNATRVNFENVLRTQDPLLVNISGHGAPDHITGQGGQYLLGLENANIMDGRVVYDLSCNSGAVLGPATINAGAISFLGYDVPFWLVHLGEEGLANPLADQFAKGFFESHNVAPIAFIRGRTILRSYQISQDTFTTWIQAWENIDSADAVMVVSYLIWDRDHQVLHPPNPVEPTRIKPVSIMPLLLLGGIGFLGISMIIPSSKRKW